ncbi:DPP IV N-terminal domain-containing protein [Tundrisphaera sp. TA3]|uniref:S9 family peptidase n=1 Tax=Tundrisphaera sp. TA3 TaxID=3435775 RepID=UPI003EBDB3EF
MLASLALSAGEARSQDVAEAYRRANRLRATTQGKVFRDHVTPHWFAGNDSFWYRNDLPDEAREFVVVEATKGVKRPAFDHAKLAAKLGDALQREVAADRLPFDAIAIDDGGAIRFAAGGKGWKYRPEADAIEEGEPPAKVDDEAGPGPGPGRRGGGEGGRRRQGSPRRDESPDGKWVAFIKDFNVYLRPKDGGDEVALSTEGVENDGYEAGVFWSPDSRKLVAMRTLQGDHRRVTLVESSPRDQVQPKVTGYDYLKPGDRVPISKPHLFDVGEKKPIEVSDALFANPWSLDRVRWSPDSSRFTFLFNQRGHQVLRVVAVDAASGEAKALIEEQSPTFVDYSNKTFLQFFDKTDEILWMSERDGWNHLYLIDAKTGAVKNWVTQGAWLVRAVDRVDEEKRQIHFRALGIFHGQDPYQVHFARVNFDGSGLTRLTVGDGDHTVRASPDGRFLVDTYSRVDAAPTVELRKAEDGSLVCELEKADDSALVASGWARPERFVAKGRDETTDIHGVIFRPTNLDPARKYPVIEQIYAGPHGAFVPKSFAPFHWPQALAELGFVVVQIDGMGTNWRSRAFHDVCAKNLADAGFPDRILWMKAAAKAYPYLDLDRVGIYGGSAGGQNALGAMLFHGDFYKAAAADCGCHDNRMDKIWWNEAWMGWPIGPHYAAQSNVTNAHKLRGALLLTVGEMDNNVDPASTMQVVDALIRANKDFELIVFPGGGHGAGGSPYGNRRMRDFFVRHLLGLAPPDRNAVPIAEDEG